MRNDSHPIDKHKEFAAKTVEKLAAIEHEQWMQWAGTMMKREPINQETKSRWKSLMVGYDFLHDAMKEHDRVWAKKAFYVVIDELKNFVKENKIKGGDLIDG